MASAPRILLIDDNDAIHDDFRKVLLPSPASTPELDEMERTLFGGMGTRPAGIEFELDDAYQGQEGVALVRSALEAANPYSMAFVDIRMPPGWDGVETIVELWKVDPHLQVCICSAHADYTWDDLTSRLGFSDQLLILKKPFDAVEVRQLATCLCRKASLAAQVRQQVDSLEATVHDKSAALESLLRGAQRIAEAAGEGIVGLDQGGRVTFANPVARQLLGYGAKEVVGSSWSDLQPGHTVATDGLLLGRRSAPGAVFRRADGSTFPVEYVVTPVRDRGLPYGAAVVFHDLTERHRAEEQLRESIVRQRVAEDARRFAERQKAFVIMASHEFRTPLATIQAASGTLERYADRLSPQQRRERIAKIQTSVAHMTQLLEDVLLLGRGDAGEMPCAPQRVRLATLCREALANAEAACVRTARLTMDAESETARVEVDPKLVNYILGNLLSNAMKYSPAGSPVTFDVRMDGPHLRFRVCDQGIGISQDDRAGLFEPFRRGANVGAVPGTGLGLAIVKRAVDAHRGSISVSSTIGEGTTFEVLLPQGPAEHAPDAPDVPAAALHRGEATLVLEG